MSVPPLVQPCEVCGTIVPLGIDWPLTHRRRNKTQDPNAIVWKTLSCSDHGIYSTRSHPKFGMVKSRCQFHLDRQLEERDQ